MREYNLYSDFDLDKHIKAYPCYTEVIIHYNGKVEYAVPSHQEKLIKLGMQKYKCSREEFIEKCPREMWGDYLTWLMNETKCICVWYDGYMGRNLSKFQKAKLQKFIDKGAMKKVPIK